MCCQSLVKPAWPKPSLGWFSLKQPLNIPSVHSLNLFLCNCESHACKYCILKTAQCICAEYFHNHRDLNMRKLETMQRILKMDLKCAPLSYCTTLYITHFICVYNYAALFWDNLYRLEFYGWPSPNREGKNFIHLTTSSPFSLKRMQSNEYQ